MATTPTGDPCVDAVGQRLRSLREPLAITAHVTRGSAEVDAILTDVREAVARFQRVAGDRLTFRVVEANGEPPRSDGPRDDLAFTGKRGNLSITFSYLGKEENMATVRRAPASTLAFWVASSVRVLQGLADRASVRFGVMGGNREIGISEPSLVPAAAGTKGPSLQSVTEQAFPFYQFETVNLRRGEAEIDPGLAGIILTQPGEAFTEEELRRIDRFLLRGNKSLLVYASAVNIADASMSATLNTWGLDGLLAGYGIEMKREALLDWGGPAGVELAIAGRPVVVRNPALALARQGADGQANPRLDSSFPGFQGLDALVLPFPSPLVPHPQVQPDAAMRVVARSTERATALTSTTLDLAVERLAPPEGGFEQRALAIAIEGKLKSAFTADHAVGARVLVVSSSQFPVNPYARAANRGLAGQNAEPLSLLAMGGTCQRV